ncbi:MAG: hypothetical protein L0H96_24655 [Humibacillus sp.]|nr:hypothetical protein [Humibacillus sp.]MDN5780074.1 hypothetical protein [Humibacillus sp.]
MALTRGWQTDLAVLRHLGSLVDHRFDHIIVTSPENTTFHWGNFVLVTDPAAADDTARWVQVFRTEFPNAEHVSIGLPRLPAEGSWDGTGLVIDTDEVLFTETLPEQRPLAEGYTARPIESDSDWVAVVALNVADTARTGAHEPAGYERFLRDQDRSRRRMVAAGVARWFGAFDAGGTLTASLGLAARWAGDQGATAWVIVTELTNPAGRLYRSVGFVPDAVQVTVSHR